MPNHVETICQLAGSPSAIAIFRIAHIRMLNDALELDFETVIPMPSSVRETERSRDVDLCTYALGYEDKSTLPSHIAGRFEENWFAEKGMTDRSQILAWVGG